MSRARHAAQEQLAPMTWGTPSFVNDEHALKVGYNLDNKMAHNIQSFNRHERKILKWEINYNYGIC